MRHQAILETESETESWLLLQHSYNYFLHFSFCFILIIPGLTELWPFKCKCHPVNLWCWLWPAISKSVIHWDRLLPHVSPRKTIMIFAFIEETLPLQLAFSRSQAKHEYRWKLGDHPVTSSMTPSPWKHFFGMIWDDLFISVAKWKLCLIFQNIKPPFWARDKLFFRKLYRKLNTPER